MELKRYWQVLVRRWWIPAVLVAMVLVISLVSMARQPVSYQTTIGLVVMRQPQAETPAYFTYSDYYSWLSSEYVIDDLSQIVETETFANDVRRWLRQHKPQAADVSQASIQGATAARRTHRMLTLTITGPTAVSVQTIAEGVVGVVNDGQISYLKRPGNEHTEVFVVNPPGTPAAATKSAVLNVGLRVALALLVGIALAFLLAYLDDTIRYPDEAEESAGVPVLGLIPPDNGRRFARTKRHK